MKPAFPGPICRLAVPAAFPPAAGAWSAAEESPVRTDVVVGAGPADVGHWSVAERTSAVAGESGFGIAIHRGVGSPEGLSPWMRLHPIDP